MARPYKFIKNTEGKWVILAPERAIRPDIAKNRLRVCPFCPGKEKLTPSEVYRTGAGRKNEPGWQIRVVPNKFPFAPTHEIIIHSPDHAANFFTYKESYIAKIFRVYKERFAIWRGKGKVFIFYNHGVNAGESLPHSHTQLVVIPAGVCLDTPRVALPENIIGETSYFTIFVPPTSSWPYEVWFVPKKRNQFFPETKERAIVDLARLFSKVLKKLQKLLGKDFPFNFYIYYGRDWYLRLFPRVKVPGGFEFGSGIFVNTTEPKKAAKQLSLGG